MSSTLMFNKIRNFIEYKRCERSPVYFINRYLKYTDFDGREITIKLFDFQKKYIKSVQKNRLNLGAWSRQNGKTTTNVGIVIWNLIFKNNKTIVFYTCNQKMNREISRKIKEFLSFLPKWLVKDSDILFYDNKLSVKNNTCFFMGPLVDIRTRTSIREVDLLVVDEFASIMKDETRQITNLIDNLDNAKISIISNLNQSNIHPFNQLFYQSKMGMNEFKTSRVYWHDHPGRDLVWEKEMIDLLGPLAFSQEYN